MNIAIFYINKIQQIWHTKSLRTVMAIILPLIAIFLIVICWSAIEKREQIRIAKNYILDIQSIENLPDDKKAKYIENIFNKSQNSLYKVYFGAKLINEIHKNDPDKAINIARQILSIPNLPEYISDAIATKLSYIYLGQLTSMSHNKIDIIEKSNEIEKYFSSNNNKKTIFYPLRKEALLEIMLLNNKAEDYTDGIAELKKISLPENMKIRLSEMQNFTKPVLQ